jgi:hypothetical protein
MHIPVTNIQLANESVQIANGSGQLANESVKIEIGADYE